MDVNLHERRLSVGAAEVAPIIDSLASEQGVWPSASWAPMVLDRGLAVGSEGGHGIIGYSVDEYVPGQRVRFRFSAPRGFHGWHEFAVVPAVGSCDLRHTLVVEPRGLTRFSWPVVFRPLHDALIEDALDKAEEHLGSPRPVSPWSWRVRFLRWAFGTVRRLRRG